MRPSSELSSPVELSSSKVGLPSALKPNTAPRGAQEQRKPRAVDRRVAKIQRADQGAERLRHAGIDGLALRRRVEAALCLHLEGGGVVERPVDA